MSEPILILGRVSSHRLSIFPKLYEVIGEALRNSDPAIKRQKHTTMVTRIRGSITGNPRPTPQRRCQHERQLHTNGHFRAVDQFLLILSGGTGSVEEKSVTQSGRNRITRLTVSQR